MPHQVLEAVLFLWEELPDMEEEEERQREEEVFTEMEEQETILQPQDYHFQMEEVEELQVRMEGVKNTVDLEEVERALTLMDMEEVAGDTLVEVAELGTGALLVTAAVAALTTLAHASTTWAATTAVMGWL